MRAAAVNLATVVMLLFVTVFCVFIAETLTKQFGPSYQIVVGPDGESDLYACEEDSPPPCWWDCATMGNRVCGASR